MFETRSIAPDVTVRIVQPGDAAVLAEAYRRNRAAVGAIVAEARETLRLHRTEASTLVHNTASPQPPPGHPAQLAPEVAAAHHRGRRNHRGRTVTGASILPA
ncbi:hypothetical protein [Microbacterium lacticum]